MTKDIYIVTKHLTGTDSVSRTMVFNKGGGHVAIDFNEEREVVGVEILDAKEIRINGKRK